MHVIVVGCGRVGYPVPHNINHRRLVQGIFMLFLTGLLFWVRTFARRKRI